ncbi:MAG: GAF domain-containing protein, partial [Candidatus Latescibacteria bacterium]|nr:GAF domain-containing protein [Candidatus Latescibacterota bacterium]
MRDEILRMRDSEDIERVLVAVRDGLLELGVSFTDCGVNLVDWIGDPPSVRSHNMAQGGRWIYTGPNVPGVGVVIQIWRGRMVNYRRDLDVEDMYGEADRIEKLFEHHIRSVVDVPFSHGTLAINSTQPNAFSPQDIELFEEMAQVLSEGFTRLDDLQLLDVFDQVGQVILSSLDLEYVVAALAQRIVKTGIFRSLMVALVDETTRRVEVVENFIRHPKEGFFREPSIIGVG